VWVEFDWGTDIYLARQIVSEKLSLVAEELPDNVNKPTLGPQSSILGELMIIGLTADSTSMLDLRTLADWTIRPRLLSTGGVAQVAVLGGDVKEYQILIDPARMRHYGVSIDEVLAATRGMNVNTNGGVMYEHSNEYIVRGMVATTNVDEIAKAVVKNAQLVIMDEPTASITVEEQKRLFEIVKELKAQGVTIIYISHRLEELFEICDRVSVLRDGQYVATVDIGETNKQHLISLMVGRELSETYPHKDPCGDEVVLRTEHLSGNGLTDINIELRRGEILGFGGLVGAGRTELMHLLYGAAKKTGGHIYINGKEVNFHSPAEALNAGIGLIPEDRKYQGFFLDKPLYWNISISNLKALSRGSFVDRKAEMAQAEEYKGKMRIKAPTMTQLGSSLSGGNQQKVVIAKAMAALPDILIFDEPTRGIDVGARAEIYQMMVELTQQGKSILMVSSDMEELLGMSERIVVLHEGEQTGVLTREEFSQETILTLASGL
jgi:ribose transport system ATP-binding protein